MKALSLLLVLLMVVPALADEAFDAGIRASWARVKERYPEARDPDSDFAKRIMEILDHWAATGDPRLHELNGPELLAEEVAAEFFAHNQRVAKRAARAKRPAARPAAPIVTAPRPRPVPAVPPWIQRQNDDDDTVISAGPAPSSATVYGADGSIRRVFNNGTGSATIYGPEGTTRIFPK